MVNTVPPTTNSSTTSTSATPSANGVKTDVRQEADAVRSAAQNDIADLKSKAQEDLHGITEAARRDFEEARNTATRFAEDRKNDAADQVDGVASAVRRLADDLETDQNPMIGRYAREIGDGLARFSESARNRSLNEILNDVQSFGRQHPGAFIAGAAVLGFVASRFLAASSERSHYGSTSGSADARDHSSEVSGNYAQEHPARSYADNNRVAAPAAFRAAREDF